MPNGPTPETERLAIILRALRLQAGQPSLRSVAADSGVSHTTVHELLGGHRTIRDWERVEKVGRALGMSRDQERALFAAWQLTRHPPEEPPGPAVQEQILEELRAIRRLLEGRQE